MACINLDVDYFDHPKTRRLIGLLGRGSAELPIRLWTYCGRFLQESGSLIDHSSQEIESIVGWWGKPGQMVDAMVKVGFLDKTRDGFKTHGWEEREGHLAAFKERAQKGAEARWGKIRGDASSNASSIDQASPKQCPIPALPNQLNQTNKTLSPALPDEAVKLAEKLRGLILSNNPKAKQPDNLNAWAKEFDLMIRSDSRTVPDIEAVMVWSQKDAFWRTNILSAGKLRKQFDQLHMKMNAPRGGQNGKQGNGFRNSGDVGDVVIL